jgi:3',5'-nucleoside bisphosphate phosphatase
MKSDFHMHSRFSDGREWPEEIVERAKKQGLQQLALTDHDSLEGVDRFMVACNKSGIKGIPGTEIDCVQPEIDFSSEILGYFPSGKYAQTKSELTFLLNRRVEMVKSAILLGEEIYNRNDFSFEDFIKFKTGEIWTLQHHNLITLMKADVYNYFVHKGIALEPLKDFKKQFFSHSAFSVSVDKKITVFDTLRMIRVDGGFPVLPHPGYLFNLNVDLFKSEKNQKDFLWMLNLLKSHGLWGVEMHVYDNNLVTIQVNKIMKQFAAECGLGITYGSDDHGKGSFRDYLGGFFGDFNNFN